MLSVISSVETTFVEIFLRYIFVQKIAAMPKKDKTKYYHD